MSSFLNGCRRALSVSVPRGVKYNVVFLGSDGFSIPVLDALNEARGDVIDQLRVVTMPDKRIGRGHRQLYRPPLRTYAEALGLPVELWQSAQTQLFEPMKDDQSSNVLVTASFGAMINAEMIRRFPPRHALNVHPSLLPHYRGAAPIQWTIANGDTHTGVTVQELSIDAFDMGDILAQRRMNVPAEANYSSLERVLAHLGGRLLVETLGSFDRCKAEARPQSGKASLASKMKAQNRVITDWALWPADRILRMDRARRIDDPPLRCYFQLEPLSLPDLRPLSEQLGATPEPGTIIWNDERRCAILGCANCTAVELHRVRPASVKDKTGIPPRLWWDTHIQRRGLGPVLQLDHCAPHSDNA